ncbi:HECT-type E3 ubiquitin transferase [Aspergillus fijiensis CBS 313.89]|uniref:Ubiquitin-conjugating enzyme E2-binding protein n=1 Tax=Aspergillus fijiensis CBS 313.89 TaxID=1448319 RepID=A0A8G1W0T9_9EURO|nr:uncharacterized protein BO72DRAFT_485142 [Aspergillus fijiensis CBS 313.89]RAK78706.1 hypothetical protein BO72DRAFT_485142 [Aspergillus fijiensis CBS 313.89]
MQPTPGTAEDEDQKNPLIYLHAELLPHIRHITLYVSVPAEDSDAHAQSQDTCPKSAKETKGGDMQITLSESRRAVSVSVPPAVSPQLPENRGDDASPETRAAMDAEPETETMKLPARVTEAARYVLRAPQWQRTSSEGRRREASFRMQVVGEGTGDQTNGTGLLAGRGGDEELGGGFVPWRAPDMRPGTRVRCRRCESVVLDQPARSAEGWVWKDLPSGNWAEMMDFWHCHKPDPEGGHEHGDGEGEGGLDAGEQQQRQQQQQQQQQGAKAGGGGRSEDPNATVKGYGAANQVVATVGTILVDVAAFLVAVKDCWGVMKVQEKQEGGTTNGSSSEGFVVGSRLAPSHKVPSLSFGPEFNGSRRDHGEDPDSDDIRCCNCNTLLGQVDPTAQGWRLFKTAISATKTKTDTGTEQMEWESYSIEVIIAAQLLELVERESARRFVVHCGHSSGLLIWVFNPDMRYSNSSAHHSIAAQRAMKVFFQPLHNVEQTLHPEVGKPSTTLALEEVRLPEETYQTFEEVLHRRNAMLPVSARVFREWRVGILHRLQ